MTLTQNERTVLDMLNTQALAFSFSRLAKETELDVSSVSTACRSLAEKGLAKFYRGLTDEDGFFCGSGYEITRAGLDFLREAKK